MTIQVGKHSPGLRVRQRMSCDGQMVSREDPGLMESWMDPAYDDAAWAAMPLPTLWEAAGLPGYDGVVWFRRTFETPPGVPMRDLTLHLGPVDDMDSTWVNGVLVGATSGCNVQRAYPVPASALRPGRNVVTVRVIDTGGGGGIYGKIKDS